MNEVIQFILLCIAPVLLFLSFPEELKGLYKRTGAQETDISPRGDLGLLILFSVLTSTLKNDIVFKMLFILCFHRYFFGYFK